MASAAPEGNPPPGNPKPALQPVPECVRDVILEVDNFFRDESILRSYLSSAFSEDGRRTEENDGGSYGSSISSTATSGVAGNGDAGEFCEASAEAGAEAGESAGSTAWLTEEKCRRMFVTVETVELGRSESYSGVKAAEIADALAAGGGNAGGRKADADANKPNNTDSNAEDLQRTESNGEDSNTDLIQPNIETHVLDFEHKWSAKQLSEMGCDPDQTADKTESGESIASESDISTDQKDLPFPLRSPGTNTISRILGKVVVDDIHANQPIPRRPTSIMDGFSFKWDKITMRGDDYSYLPPLKEGSSKFPIREDGKGDARDLSPFTVRITTGAFLPRGHDTVIPWEDVRGETHDGVDPNAPSLRILKIGKEKQWVRQIGSDTKAGSCIIPRGTILGGGEVGALAAAGIATIRLEAKEDEDSRLEDASMTNCRRWRIGVASTGDEIVPNISGKSVDTAAIGDANRPILLSLLHGWERSMREHRTSDGIEIYDLGILRDNEGGIQETLLHADVDLVVFSGGVSKGAKDFVRPLIEKNGTLRFTQLNMKPGKPTCFGSVIGTNTIRHVREAVSDAGLINPVSALSSPVTVDSCSSVQQLAGTLLAASPTDPSRNNLDDASRPTVIKTRAFIRTGPNTNREVRKASSVPTPANGSSVYGGSYGSRKSTPNDEEEKDGKSTPANDGKETPLKPENSDSAQNLNTKASPTNTESTADVTDVEKEDAAGGRADASDAKTDAKARTDASSKSNDDCTIGIARNFGENQQATTSTRRARKLVFGLPGNPSSCFVTFNLLVRPCLEMLDAGASDLVGAFQGFRHSLRVQTLNNSIGSETSETSETTGLSMKTRQTSPRASPKAKAREIKASPGGDKDGGANADAQSKESDEGDQKNQKSATRIDSLREEISKIAFPPFPQVLERFVSMVMLNKSSRFQDNQDVRVNVQGRGFQHGVDGGNGNNAGPGGARARGGNGLNGGNRNGNNNGPRGARESAGKLTGERVIAENFAVLNGAGGNHANNADTTSFFPQGTSFFELPFFDFGNSSGLSALRAFKAQLGQKFQKVADATRKRPSGSRKGSGSQSGTTKGPVLSVLEDNHELCSISEKDKIQMIKNLCQNLSCGMSFGWSGGDGRGYAKTPSDGKDLIIPTWEDYRHGHMRSICERYVDPAQFYVVTRGRDCLSSFLFSAAVHMRDAVELQTRAEAAGGLQKERFEEKNEAHEQLQKEVSQKQQKERSLLNLGTQLFARDSRPASATQPSYLPSHLGMVPVITLCELTPDPVRPEYKRASAFFVRKKGTARTNLNHAQIFALATGFQRSSRVESLVNADMLMYIPAGKDKIPEGSMVWACTLPLSYTLKGNSNTSAPSNGNGANMTSNSNNTLKTAGSTPSRLAVPGTISNSGGKSNISPLTVRSSLTSRSPLSGSRASSKTSLIGAASSTTLKTSPSRISMTPNQPNMDGPKIDTNSRASVPLSVAPRFFNPYAMEESFMRTPVFLHGMELFGKDNSDSNTIPKTAPGTLPNPGALRGLSLIAKIEELTTPAQEAQEGSKELSPKSSFGMGNLRRISEGVQNKTINCEIESLWKTTVSQESTPPKAERELTTPKEFNLSKSSSTTHRVSRNSGRNSEPASKNSVISTTSSGSRPSRPSKASPRAPPRAITPRLSSSSPFSPRGKEMNGKSSGSKDGTDVKGKESKDARANANKPNTKTTDNQKKKPPRPAASSASNFSKESSSASKVTRSNSKSEAPLAGAALTGAIKKSGDLLKYTRDPSASQFKPKSRAGSSSTNNSSKNTKSNTNLTGELPLPDDDMENSSPINASPTKIGTCTRWNCTPKGANRTPRNPQGSARGFSPFRGVGNSGTSAATGNRGPSPTGPSPRGSAGSAAKQRSQSTLSTQQSPATKKKAITNTLPTTEKIIKKAPMPSNRSKEEELGLVLTNGQPHLIEVGTCTRWNCTPKGANRTPRNPKTPPRGFSPFRGVGNSNSSATGNHGNVRGSSPPGPFPRAPSPRGGTGTSGKQQTQSAQQSPAAKTKSVANTLPATKVITRVITKKIIKKVPMPSNLSKEEELGLLLVNDYPQLIQGRISLDMAADFDVMRRVIFHFRSFAGLLENIDVMNSAGFCRNCLSKWLFKNPTLGPVLMEYAGEKEPDKSKVEDFAKNIAKTFVYGMDYNLWKKKYQKGPKLQHKPPAPKDDAGKDGGSACCPAPVGGDAKDNGKDKSSGNFDKKDESTVEKGDSIYLSALSNTVPSVAEPPADVHASPCAADCDPVPTADQPPQPAPKPTPAPVEASANPCAGDCDPTPGTDEPQGPRKELEDSSEEKKTPLTDLITLEFLIKTFGEKENLSMTKKLETWLEDQSISEDDLMEVAGFNRGSLKSWRREFKFRAKKSGWIVEKENGDGKGEKSMEKFMPTDRLAESGVEMLSYLRELLGLGKIERKMMGDPNMFDDGTIDGETEEVIEETKDEETQTPPRQTILSSDSIPNLTTDSTQKATATTPKASYSGAASSSSTTASSKDSKTLPAPPTLNPPLKIAVLTISDRATAGTYDDLSGPAFVKASKQAFPNCEVHPAGCVPDDVKEIRTKIKEICDPERARVSLSTSPDPAFKDRFDLEASDKAESNNPEYTKAQSTLPYWLTKPHPFDLIITTGGTGFAARDVTPEAVKPLFVKEAPHIANLVVDASREALGGSGGSNGKFGNAAGDRACLSRSVAGVIQNKKTNSKTLLVTFPGNPNAAAVGVEALKTVVPYAARMLRDQCGEEFQELDEIGMSELGEWCVRGSQSCETESRTVSKAASCVSGGSSSSSSSTTTTRFHPNRDVPLLTDGIVDPDGVVAQVRDPGFGAICVFHGITRNNFKNRQVSTLNYAAYKPIAYKPPTQNRQVSTLNYEAYKPMAEAELRRACRDIETKFQKRMSEEEARKAPAVRCALQHKLGDCPVGETSLVIAVGSPHRKDSYEACEELLEYVKLKVPIWKKEFFADGEMLVEGPQGVGKVGKPGGKPASSKEGTDINSELPNGTYGTTGEGAAKGEDGIWKENWGDWKERMTRGC